MSPGVRRAFDHFCMHTGGRGVLDAMEQQLRLPAHMMQPSRAALWRCAACLQAAGLVHELRLMLSVRQT